MFSAQSSWRPIVKTLNLKVWTLPLIFLHDFTLFVIDMHQNRYISLFSTPFDHFHFYPLAGLIWWVPLRSCHTLFVFELQLIPMMTHLSEAGSWYMRGPPLSPKHGPCHSPFLNSSFVPNILYFTYFVSDTIRLTLLSNLLSSCFVQSSCLLSVVNLNYLTGTPVKLRLH